MNSERFPVLSKTARDVLAILISIVASKSVFSIGERVLDTFRSSLTPKIVEALICGQNWLQLSSYSLCLEEQLEELKNFKKGIRYFYFIFYFCI